MPLSKKAQRVMAITLLNVIYLGILVIIIHNNDAKITSRPVKGSMMAFNTIYLNPSSEDIGSYRGAVKVPSSITRPDHRTKVSNKKTINIIAGGNSHENSEVTLSNGTKGRILKETDNNENLTKDNNDSSNVHIEDDKSISGMNKSHSEKLMNVRGETKEITIQSSLRTQRAIASPRLLANLRETHTTISSETPRKPVILVSSLQEEYVTSCVEDPHASKTSHLRKDAETLKTSTVAATPYPDTLDSHLQEKDQLDTGNLLPKTKTKTKVPLASMNSTSMSSPSASGGVYHRLPSPVMRSGTKISTSNGPLEETRDLAADKTSIQAVNVRAISETSLQKLRGSMVQEKSREVKVLKTAATSLPHAGYITDTTTFLHKEADQVAPMESSSWTRGLQVPSVNLLKSTNSTDPEIFHSKFTGPSTPENFLTDATIQSDSQATPTHPKKCFPTEGHLQDAKPDADPRAFLPKGSSTIPISHILLDITVSMTGVTLQVNNAQVYSDLNNTMFWGSMKVRLHAGLHLITLHQVTGQVMTADSYMTWQATSDTQFISALKEIQNGRLLVIIGAPDFTTYLGDETIAALEELGAHYIDRLAYMDVWCLLVHKGEEVVKEALTTSSPQHNSTKFEVSPLSIQVSVPRKKERQCGWYDKEEMRERATFCETYDGYGDFCSCDDPPWSPLPHNSVRYKH
ncbi:uncharacterized protein LOC121857897 [Homarus americanus]|uniref:uncharacterized protein LOC121857897 n=1 Tax=Homarus americanus TaxID=6706 RepID=UPI001C46F6B3|nr:uncharacterized protein LOC121857897 [Homarus americanus]